MEQQSGHKLSATRSTLGKNRNLIRDEDYLLIVAKGIPLPKLRHDLRVIIDFFAYAGKLYYHQAQHTAQIITLQPCYMDKTLLTAKKVHDMID